MAGTPADQDAPRGVPQPAQDAPERPDAYPSDPPAVPEGPDGVLTVRTLLGWLLVSTGLCTTCVATLLPDVLVLLAGALVMAGGLLILRRVVRDAD